MLKIRKCFDHISSVTPVTPKKKLLIRFGHFRISFSFLYNEWFWMKISLLSGKSTHLKEGK